MHSTDSSNVQVYQLHRYYPHRSFYLTVVQSTSLCIGMVKPLSNCYGAVCSAHQIKTRHKTCKFRMIRFYGNVYIVCDQLLLRVQF